MLDTVQGAARGGIFPGRDLVVLDGELAISVELAISLAKGLALYRAESSGIGVYGGPKPEIHFVNHGIGLANRPEVDWRS